MKVIPVYSGKGGTGKSCVSAYTAAALAAQRKKTLLIDAGKAPGALDIILGAQNSAVYNLADILTGACDAATATVSVAGHENLYLIPAGLSSGVRQRGLPELLAGLRHGYDFIIIDGAGPELLAQSRVFCSIIVTTPDTLSVRGAAQKCRELYDYGANNIRLVVNNVPARVVPMKSYQDFDDIVDQVGAQLIAVIPQSQRLHHSANNGLPLSRESIIPEVFTRLAERLRGKQAPLLIR